jgi:hypothetical protein
MAVRRTADSERIVGNSEIIANNAPAKEQSPGKHDSSPNLDGEFNG